MQKIKHLFSKIKFTTPVAIIFAAVILAASHIGYGFVLSNNAPATPTVAFKGRAIDATDLATGKEKAKVFLVEYSDTECPFCAQLYPTIKQIKETYGDKIGFVYRYFPLTQIHQNSFEESRSVYCVGKELGSEKRQAYIDQMFEYKWSKKNMTLAKGQKEQMAAQIGVNTQTYSACMLSDESKNAIDASIQDGVAAGVQGTPATFVLIKTKKGYENVSLVDGARPFEFFKAIIDGALAR